MPGDHTAVRHGARGAGTRCARPVDAAGLTRCAAGASLLADQDRLQF